MKKKGRTELMHERVRREKTNEAEDAVAKAVWSRGVKSRLSQPAVKLDCDRLVTRGGQIPEVWEDPRRRCEGGGWTNIK